MCTDYDRLIARDERKELMAALDRYVNKVVDESLKRNKVVCKCSECGEDKPIS